MRPFVDQRPSHLLLFLEGCQRALEREKGCTTNALHIHPPSFSLELSKTRSDGGLPDEVVSDERPQEGRGGLER